MTAAEVVADAQAAPKPVPPPRRARRGARWATVLLAVVLGVLVLGLGVRFGVLTDPGRGLVLKLANGWRCGPVGRLRVEGLEGDVFGRFKVRRAAIYDPRGEWITATDLTLDWRPVEMLQRRFHAERVTFTHLTALRVPEMERHAPTPLEPPPIGVQIDAFAGRVESLPALTVAHGDWNATGAFTYPRDLHSAGRLLALSRLHAGDHIAVDFTFTDLKRLKLHADALEVKGGAVAGGLGLAADRPFKLLADVKSDVDGGFIDVDSRLGAERPLWAKGRWTPTTGAVEAWAMLAASKHTDHYVTRIGPLAHLVMHVDKAGAGHVVEGTLTGDFATAHAHGPVDPDKLRVLGVKLEAQVKDLSAWFKPPHIGFTTATATATGGWGDLVIEGRAQGHGLSELDTTIATLEGPVRISHLKGEWRVKTDVVGSGLGGPGLLAPLLGPHPVANVELSRFDDERVLFRALKVTGAKLKVDATGDIDLFGNLAFRGRFDAPSIVGVRPGARGALTATFDARSKRDSNFWNTHLQGGATGFSGGENLAEFDRLMGPNPRVTAEATWQPSGWTVQRADVTGLSASATARGTVSTQKVYGLEVDWRAKGPFMIGPLEAAGELKGSGRITGTIDEPRADLVSQLTSIDFGQLVIAHATLNLAFVRAADKSVAGTIALDGPTANGPAHASAAFHALENGGLDLTDVAANAGGVKLAGSLALRDGAPSTAALTVDARPGAFLSSGQLQGTVRIAGVPGPGGARATLQLFGHDLVQPGSTLVIAKLRLDADGPIDRLPYRVEVSGASPVNFVLAGEGVLARTGSGTGEARELNFSGGGKLRGAPVKTLEPLMLRFGTDLAEVRARLALAGGRLVLDGRQARGALTANADLSGVGLEALDADYTGAVTGKLSLAGQGRALGGRLDVTLAGARSRDATPDLALDGRLQAVLEGARLKVTTDATNAQGLKAHAAVDLPAEAAAQPFRIAVDRTKPLRGDFEVDGELRPLWDLFAGGDRTLSGHVTAHGVVGGALNDPQVTGEAALAVGAFRDGPTGLLLKNVEGQASFGKNLVTVRAFKGDDGRGGKLSGEGSASLFREGGSNLQLNLARFQLLDNELGRATASGAVSIVRDAQGHARLQGKLTIDRADITANPPAAAGVPQMDVVEINRIVRMEDTPALFKTTSRGASLVALDVSIGADRGIFVRGRGLDAELSLDAHVGGATAAPELSGQAQIIRGSYDFSGKKFDFDEFGVIRLASRPELIRLDLSAERNEDGLDARVRVRGTAARPEISLTSVPVLPQDEVLSRVLFGVSASQLSPFEAAQLASAVASLATGGGFDVFGSLRQFARLDRLTMGGGPSGATVSGGKYVTDNIYVELTGAGTSRGDNPTQLLQTGRTGSSATVEWRVRRNLSLVSQAWTGGDVRLSVRFRKNK